MNLHLKRLRFKCITLTTFLKLKEKVFEVLTNYLMTHAVLKTVTKYLFLETEGVKHKGTGQFLLGSYTFWFIIIVIMLLGFLASSVGRMYFGEILENVLGMQTIFVVCNITNNRWCIETKQYTVRLNGISCEFFNEFFICCYLVISLR